MSAYQKILITTDLSPHAAPIAKRAQDIAATHKATLYVIHVLEHSPLVYGGEYAVPLDISFQEQLKKTATEKLTAFSHTMNLPTDQVFLKTGSVKQEVRQLAEALSIDLIIVGHRSPHGIERLLGTRANAILHTAPCDVLTCHIA